MSRLVGIRRKENRYDTRQIQTDSQWVDNASSVYWAWLEVDLCRNVQGWFWQKPWCSWKSKSGVNDKKSKGIEIYNSIHLTSDVKRYEKLAKKYNLLTTGGSDFHGESKNNVSVGQIVKNYEEVENYKNASILEKIC